jgi:hypothetical protein
VIIIACFGVVLAGLSWAGHACRDMFRKAFRR